MKLRVQRDPVARVHRTKYRAREERVRERERERGREGGRERSRACTSSAWIYRGSSLRIQQITDQHMHVRKTTKC